jgi:hypothetical protein
MAQHPVVEVHHHPMVLLRGRRPAMMPLQIGHWKYLLYGQIAEKRTWSGFAGTYLTAMLKVDDGKAQRLFP